MAVTYLAQLLMTGEEQHKKVYEQVRALVEAPLKVEADKRCRQEMARFLG